MHPTDLENVLRDYDVQDEATLKKIYGTLAHLDLQEGNSSAALEKIKKVHELESKPDLKLYTFPLFETEAIVFTQKEFGISINEDFKNSFRRILSERYAALPNSFYEQIRFKKIMTDFMGINFVATLVESIEPDVKKNGNKIYGDLAMELVEQQTMWRFFVPLLNEIRQSAEEYLSTHSAPEKINIWTERTVTLSGENSLNPVTVAIWDTGLDYTVFPEQLFLNPTEQANEKDNDGNGFIADVHGIGIDNTGKVNSQALFPLSDTDAKQFPDWKKDRRLGEQFVAGVDNEETRAFMAEVQAETPKELMEDSRKYDLYSFYNHGTQVASIAIDGNPAARILNARFTWRDNADPIDTTQSYEQWADAFAINVKAFVEYFKNHGVRVVNMSWSMTRTGTEENLENWEPKLSAERRKMKADKIFAIIKNALKESIENAPDILFVVSAGNTNSDADFNEAVPSSLELSNIITAGAVDETGSALKFTSYGKTVSLYALGIDIPAKIPGGETLKFGGTSAAAPQVTNLAAKLFALNPKLTVHQVIQLIRNGADVSASDDRLNLINPVRSVSMLSTTKTK